MTRETIANRGGKHREENKYKNLGTSINVRKSRG